LRQVVREELSKALALPAGATTTAYSPAYLNSLAARPRTVRGQQAAPEVMFGPGNPLAYAGIDPSRPGDPPAPRRWEYPLSWNIQTTAPVPWAVLRDAADGVSVMRSCIETRKSTVTSLEWGFGIDSSRVRHLAKRAGTSDYAVASDLRDRYADDIDRLHQWWTMPDRLNRWSFADRVNALLEDLLVIDAVAVYPHLAMGGELHSAEILDGSTIRPLLDNRGGTPQPPNVAYQQVLHGFPRTDLSLSEPALDSAHDFVSAIYGPAAPSRADALIYKVRNRRSRGPYGFSPTEQALTDIDLWLKRYEWLRAEYTAGTAPEMLVNVDATMTPEQLRQYEAVFNDELSGHAEERHRARFLPAGFAATYRNLGDSRFSSDFDLHLIRLICAAYAVPPTSIGFTPNHGMGGMGGQGHIQGEQDYQTQRSTKPTAQWVSALINEISSLYLGMPPEVTFQVAGLDTEDDERDAQLLTGYIAAGVKTLNEGRDHLGLPRYDFPEASQPFISTPTGPAWLNVDGQPTAVPGNLPSAQVAAGPSDSPALHDTPDAGDPVKTAMADERRAFTAYARKRGGRWRRDFQFSHHPADVASSANRLAEAGDLTAASALLDLAATSIAGHGAEEQDTSLHV
jgi:hypothetical protein